MRTVYIADDGTKFDNEYDCKEYEYEMKIKDSNIIMLDKDENLLEIKNENYGICCYIKITNEKDLKIIKEISWYTGLYEKPEEIGEFYYNFENGIWCSIDDKIIELENDLKELKNIKEKLNGYQN